MRCQAFIRRGRQCSRPGVKETAIDVALCAQHRWVAKRGRLRVLFNGSILAVEPREFIYRTHSQIEHDRRRDLWLASPDVRKSKKRRR